MTMNNTINNSYDFCNDPDAAVAEASLKDFFSPCSQLAVTVPLFIVTQLLLLTAASFWKEHWMRRSGVAEEDIKMIVSSRRNHVCHNGKEGGEKETSNSTDAAASANEHEETEGNMDEEVAAPKTNIDPNHEVVHSEQPPNQDSNAKDLDEVPNIEGNSEAATIPTPPINEATGVRQFDLHYLLQEYGDKKLRVIDSICRKTVHFTGGFCLMIQLQFISNTFVAYGQTGLFGAAATTIIFLVCCFIIPDSWIATRLFGGVARIRDGKFARFNQTTAYSGMAVGMVVNYILSMVAIIPHVQDSHFQTLLAALAYTPLTVGDALGELIGGPFGGTFFPTFQVKGLGEINRKSVEGCTAVFAGSFVPSCVVCALFGATSPSWILLCFCLAITSTIVETIAFRSTDNFFIPFGNVLVMMIAFGAFGDHFN